MCIDSNNPTLQNKKIHGTTITVYIFGFKRVKSSSLWALWLCVCVFWVLFVCLFVFGSPVLVDESFLGILVD